MKKIDAGMEIKKQELELRKREAYIEEVRLGIRPPPYAPYAAAVGEGEEEAPAPVVLRRSPRLAGVPRFGN